MVHISALVAILFLAGEIFLQTKQESPAPPDDPDYHEWADLGAKEQFPKNLPPKTNDYYGDDERLLFTKFEHSAETPEGIRKTHTEVRDATRLIVKENYGRDGKVTHHSIRFPKEEGKMPSTLVLGGEELRIHVEGEGGETTHTHVYKGMIHTHTIQHTYGDDGEVSERVTLGPKMNPLYKKVYAGGKVSRTVFYEPTGGPNPDYIPKFTHTHKYERSGELKRRLVSADGKPLFTVVHHHEDGRPVHTHIEDPQGNLLGVHLHRYTDGVLTHTDLFDHTLMHTATVYHSEHFPDDPYTEMNEVMIPASSQGPSH